MSLSEADTRAKLIDPILHRRGWTEDLFCREETARAGGFEALKNLGNPNEIVNETKRRLFAA
jgi:type I site-specific restriction endonuclease